MIIHIHPTIQEMKQISVILHLISRVEKFTGLLISEFVLLRDDRIPEVFWATMYISISNINVLGS